MKNYLNTLIAEKGISAQHLFTIQSDSVFGDHFVPLEVVIEFISALDKQTQLHIKWTLVKIDFQNGDILQYLEYICKGMVQVNFG